MTTAYHLRRAVRPRVLVAVPLLGYLIWLCFRWGGTEVGPGALSPWGLARYWVILTPILLIVLTPLLGRLWAQPRLMANWRLGNAGTAAIARDGYLNFLAGYLVFAALVLACACYPLFRVEMSAAALGSALAMTLAGPLIGGYLALAAGYLVGLVTGSPAGRITTVIVLAVADAVNELPSVALSVSGTSAQTERAGAWPRMPTEPWFREVVLPSQEFVTARVAVAAVLTIALSAAAVRRARRVPARAWTVPSG